MVNLTIDGRQISVEENTTIMEAARSVGIQIPSLCYLKGINEIGACRVCVVELEGKDSLDRLLHYLKVHQTAEKDESGKVTGRKYEKAAAGWIVPLAVGFKGLSPLGKVKNQRDPDTPHRFAESIVTLGEFKMAHRFRDIDGMMWHYAYEKTNQLYLCKNKE